MNKLKKNLLIVLSLIVMYIVFKQGYVPNSIIYFSGIKHAFYTPTDFYNYNIKDDNFNFYKKGYSEKYDIDFKYFTRYTISMRDKNKRIPQEVDNKQYEFQGIIKIDFFFKNKLIKTDYINNWNRCIIEDSLYCSSCELFDFLFPMENTYKDLSIKLTVIEPIKLSNSNDLYLYIGASSVYR